MALPLYYNWRNLARRKTNTLLTFLVVMTVVLVLAILLSFGAGIQESPAHSGIEGNLVVLKPGATAESTSIVSYDEASHVMQTPHLARNASGEPMLSQELCVQTTIPRRTADRNLANVAIRGVDDIAFDVHSSVKIVKGRRFRQGAREIIVGQAASDRYENLELGDDIALGILGNRLFRVVGIFEEDGGAMESEIWGPRTMISDVYERRFLSSLLLRLQSPNNLAQAKAYIDGPTVELAGSSETDYYAELSQTTRDIVFLTIILVGIMVVGAIFAVANTMYAAVDGRKREIAMLRTIGFSRRAIIMAFLVESSLICGLACICGLAISLTVGGGKQDFMSDTTYTVLAYDLRITPAILMTAFATSLAVGVSGALAPALKASRTKVIEALRKA